MKAVIWFLAVSRNKRFCFSFVFAVPESQDERDQGTPLSLLQINFVD
jgi:hypothetical protein